MAVWIHVPTVADFSLTVNAYAASGDTTGVTDAAMFNALAGDGVTIVPRPFQTYYVTSLPTVTPRRGLVGIGCSTVFMHVGNGPCLKITDSNFTGNSQQIVALGGTTGTTIIVPAYSQIAVGMGVNGTGLTNGTGGFAVSAYVPSTGTVTLSLSGTASGTPSVGATYSFGPPAVYLDNTAGQVGGFIIDGLRHDTSAASCGIQMGDIYGANVQNVVVRNYSNTSNYLTSLGTANRTITTSATLGVGATLTSVVSNYLSLTAGSGGYPNSGLAIQGVVRVPTNAAKGYALLGYTGTGTARLTGISIIDGAGGDVIQAGAANLNLAAGDAGLWVNNVTAWTEENDVRIMVDNCQNAVLFDSQSTASSPSHEYNSFDITARCYPNQNGLVLQNGCHHNGKIKLRGNYESGAAGTVNNGAIFTIGMDGAQATIGSTGTAGPAAITELTINTECNNPLGASPVNHTSVLKGPNAVVLAQGVISTPGAQPSNIALPDTNFVLSGFIRADTPSGGKGIGKYPLGHVSIGTSSATSGFSPGNGTTALGGTIWSGTGAPSIAASVAGDIYFRTDTPSTANQRVYIATAANTWTGVV